MIFLIKKCFTSYQIKIDLPIILLILLKELKRYVMNVKRTLLLIILLCRTTGSFTAIFDYGQPFTVQQKEWWPWTGFFNSMFARKELATGNYPVVAEISGYVAHVPFWDTRQIDSIFEGLFLFAPKPVVYDPLCKDINGTGQFNIVVMETRARAKLYGPEVLGAESFGYIEADFLGTDAVAARLRCHLAYLKLTWKNAGAYMITGLYYHPLRLAHIDLDPKVISHNAGAPIHPNVRTPQFKIGKHWQNNLNLEFIAMGEFDITDFDPTDLDPTDFDPIEPSFASIRRSLTPMMDIRLWIGPESTKHLIGIGFDIKRIMPRLVTNKCVRTRESLTSVAFDIYAKLTAEPLSIRTQFIWAQNAAYYNMLGGYAVKCIDPTTDIRTYTNMNTLSYWIDFNVDKKISPGFFGGYSRVLGTDSCITPTYTNPLTGVTESLTYGRTPNIKYMARLAPRIRFNIKPVVFGAELEWTRAGYGTIQTSGRITNVKPANNIRVLLSSYYFF